MPERIYLDATPAIWFVEHAQPQSAAVHQRLAAPGVEVVASTLTRLECRVKPMRAGDFNLLADFDLFFGSIVATLVALSDDVIDRATEIRAKYPFKTPDAIHLAAAVLSSCDVFLTNDQQLQQFPDIAVELVQP